MEWRGFPFQYIAKESVFRTRKKYQIVVPLIHELNQL
jgi:hypothetical protein